VDLISHAVWLDHVLSRSFRDVELLLADRGIIVSYESIRRWCLKFGGAFADDLRRHRPRPGDKWHLDEVFNRIQGELRYLWRTLLSAVERRERPMQRFKTARRKALPIVPRRAKAFKTRTQETCGQSIG